MSADSSSSRDPGSRASDESAERFRSLADGVGAILWESDLPSWRFSFVSHQAESILGYPVQRWLDEPDFWVEHIHPDDREDAIAYCRRCTEAGEDHEFEYRAIAADGSVIWLRDIVRVVREAGVPRRLRGVMVDITARKRADEELLVRTGQLAAVSSAMTEFLETGDWRAASAALLRNALDCTESEYGFIGVVVDDTLRVLAHEGICWDDATGRGLYEDALRLYEERGYMEFTSFDNLFGHVVTDRRAVLSNDPSGDERSAGLPPGHPPLRQFLGVPIFNGDDVVGMVGIANRSSGYTEEDQDRIEIICRAVGVLYESYLRGIREAALESEHRQLESRFRQSQKMEALGQLAGGIAHDFNNALTVILVNAEVAALLLEPDGAPVDRGELGIAIEEIHRSGERAAELTRQLLIFGRQQVAKRERVDPNRLVADLMQMLERLIGEHIRLEVDLAPTLPCVEADPAQLERAILNLTLNARDAMPDGGKLSVATWSEAPPGPDAGDGNGQPAPAGQVVLEVRDTGCGMDPQTLERIFEPFFTTKPVGQGTGLGLATVYAIVNQAGGRVTVVSEPGAGSSFRVVLPALEAKPAHGDDVQATASPAESAAAVADGSRPRPGAERGRTVLVCEDEPAVRRLLCSILRGAGYRILEAADPEHALLLAREHPGPIDLLVTDVVMPWINGRALADRLRHENADLKVLFVSGYTPDDLAPQGVDELELLAKPFSASDLIGRAQRLLA